MAESADHDSDVKVLLQEMNFPEELVVNRSVDVLKQEILQHREIRKIGRD